LLASPHSARLRQLPRTSRSVLAAALAAVGASDVCLWVVLWFRAAAPGSLLLDWRELDRQLFGAQAPSRIERLLEADAERIEGGSSMRPAFTADSVGWEETIQHLSEQARAELLQEREGERQALLAWVRSGASRAAYEQDDFDGSALGPPRPLTPKYRVGDSQSSGRIRIRTLIADRCVTCHSDQGRHDTARFLPLDSYERLAARLAPDSPDTLRAWLVAVLITLPFLGLAAGLAGWFSAQPMAVRRALLGVSLAATGLALSGWWTGREGTWNGPLVLASAAVATLAALVELLAALGDLLRPPDAAD